MSDNSDNELDPEAEAYASAITRKLLILTIGGTIAFSAIIVVLWYVF